MREKHHGEAVARACRGQAMGGPGISGGQSMSMVAEETVGAVAFAMEVHQENSRVWG